MKTYGHNVLTHIASIIVSFIFFLCGLMGSTDPHFKGGLIARFAFAIAFLLCGAVVAALYLTSLANRYGVTNEGLHVRGLSRSSFYAWNEITRISWNVPLHTLFVYGTNGMIFYSSTDCFPRLVEFLRIVHERSKCQLSPTLEKALGVSPVRT